MRILIYQCADLQIDTASGEVSQGTKSIVLSGLNLSLLTALVRQAPERLSHEKLALAVWERNVVSDATIAKRISLLREALSPFGVGGDLIMTYPHKRYGLSDTVIALQADTTNPLQRSNKLVFGAVAAGLVAVSAIVFTAYLSSRDSEPPRLIHPETGMELVAPK